MWSWTQQQAPLLMRGNCLLNCYSKKTSSKLGIRVLAWFVQVSALGDCVITCISQLYLPRKLRKPFSKSAIMFECFFFPFVKLSKKRDRTDTCIYIWKLKYLLNLNWVDSSWTCRYDVALNLNTQGPFRLLSFAKKCKRLRLFLHVSTGTYAYICAHRNKDGALISSICIHLTMIRILLRRLIIPFRRLCWFVIFRPWYPLAAYVNGERRGVVREKPFHMGQSIAEEMAIASGTQQSFSVAQIGCPCWDQTGVGDGPKSHQRRGRPQDERDGFSQVINCFAIACMIHQQRPVDRGNGLINVIPGSYDCELERECSGGKTRTRSRRRWGRWWSAATRGTSPSPLSVRASSRAHIGSLFLVGSKESGSLMSNWFFSLISSTHKTV